MTEALAGVVRRAYLGFLLIWRRFRMPTEEIDAQRELSAEQVRALNELRQAAEEYHWAILKEDR
jgi:hypothetical protein